MSPTISTKKPKTKQRALKSQQSMEREKLILLIVSIALGASILIHLISWIVIGVVRDNARERDREAIQEEQVKKLAELDESFAEKVTMVEREQKERLAVKARESEYEKRRNMDPECAKSEIEKSLLKMRELAGAGGGEQTIIKLARLANPYPPGDDKDAIKVESDRKGRGYIVTVRVDLEAIIKKIRGRYLMKRADGRESLYLKAVHNQLYDIAQWMIYDLMIYGYNHNVYKVRVLCQQPPERGGEPKDMLVISGTRKSDRTPSSPDFITFREEQDKFLIEK